MSDGDKSEVSKAADELFEMYSDHIYCNGHFGCIQSIAICERNEYDNLDRIIIYARKLKECRALIKFTDYKGFPVEVKYIGHVTLC